MTTTLSEGVKVPDVGSVNWAGDLEVNWNLLNGALANLSGNVKLDRDNIWTGEQSFTLPIVGSITGTAAKAIADEDGTSIKTGYGKLAGSQTWSGINTYNDGIYTKTGFRAINDSYSSGTPSANIFYSALAYGGLVSNTFTRSFSIDGAIRTTGYNDLSLRVYSQTGEVLSGVLIESNATASDIAFRPLINGTHKLGSSSYQWSSVYAQTYYYNGTAWGLDKENIWTSAQTYSAYNYGQMIWLKNTGLDFSVNGNTGLSSAYQHVISWVDKNNTRYSSVQSWTNSSENVLVLRSYYRTDANTSRNLSVRFVNTATNKSIYSETNADTDLGTSTNKWKTLNGINPGALSFPSLNYSQWIDLSGNLTEGEYWYYPIVDGWVFVIANSNPVSLNVLVLGDTGRLISGAIGVLEAGVGAMWVSSPAPAGSRVRIRLNNGSTGVLEAAWFIPCFGNV